MRPRRAPGGERRIIIVHRHQSLCAAGIVLAALGWGVARSAAAEPSEDLSGLRAELERLAQENRELRDTVTGLAQEVRAARDAARAAEDMARVRTPLPAVSAPPSGAAMRSDTALLSRSLGRANFQLLDVSLDVLAAGGFSSATDEELEALQGGDHDPRQRGFTLQAAELFLAGAVDPYVDAQASIVYFLDPEGETRIELEEAFVLTRQLPFGLEEHGFQLEAGHFFTEFGRLNPLHAHLWSWQDQPLILSRFFGEDGMRGPGLRVGWLTPLPWFSELHFGIQNAKGETMVSFFANDEVFEERPIGGRPFAEERVGSPGDLVKLLRWVNGFDVSDTLSGQVGLSGLFGPNATGPDGRTRVYGADVVLKWRPLQTDRGWPFLIFEAEILRRAYKADDFTGCLEEEDCASPVFVAEDTLRDWGYYAQLLWGFQRNWAVGLRYEHASGDGPGFDAAEEMFVSRDNDPFRADRTRIAPLLIWHPSEFSRIRLQYNYDRADHLPGKNEHSVWAGLEFLFGAHPAHTY